MNTCESLNIRVGGTLINNLIGSPGFVYESGVFLLHRSSSMEFERTNPLACTVRKLDLVGTGV